MEQAEYRSTDETVEMGKAPGMKVKLLSTLGDTQTYMIVFSKGDEVVSGLTEFAKKYDVKSAHYQGIGSAFNLELGWFDFERLEYMVIPVGVAEVTSLIGNITLYNGNPVSHTHTTAAIADGSIKGGHLLKLISGPTIEIVITLEPTPLNKIMDAEFNALRIDTSL
ncbi:MAG: DNA-binding protein [Chryseobacterium sp.]|nr:MAG: DNA-binding protein [Chryseobacterium sp.]